MMSFEIRYEVVLTAHSCAVDTSEGCDRLSLYVLSGLTEVEPTSCTWQPQNVTCGSLVTPAKVLSMHALHCILKSHTVILLAVFRDSIGLIPLDCEAWCDVGQDFEFMF